MSTRLLLQSFCWNRDNQNVLLYESTEIELLLLNDHKENTFQGIFSNTGHIRNCTN